MSALTDSSRLGRGIVKRARQLAAVVVVLSIAVPGVAIGTPVAEVNRATTLNGTGALTPTSQTLSEAQVTALANAAASSRAGDVSAQSAGAYPGYIWMNSHKDGGTYSVLQGTKVTVKAGASDPYDYGMYQMSICVMDLTTNEVVRLWAANHYVDVSDGLAATIDTSILRVSTGRYLVLVALWDGFWEEIEDYQSFALDVKGSAHLSQPNVPSAINAGKPFGLSGIVDAVAATGPIKLVFYQNIKGSWVLQKTVYAKWSNYTSTGTKYLADVTLAYPGSWRVGASYGGNDTYIADYKYRDFVVGPKASAHLSQPNVPSTAAANKLFGLTGVVDKAAATGPIKLVFYQNVRGIWVLQKTEYAKWSNYNSTVTKYLADVSVSYAGTWRIGASYGGNDIYASDYKYRDFVVGIGN